LNSHLWAAAFGIGKSVHADGRALLHGQAGELDVAVGKHTDAIDHDAAKGRALRVLWDEA